MRHGVSLSEADDSVGAPEGGAALDAVGIHRHAIVFDGLDVGRLEDDHVRRWQRGGVTAVNHTVTLGDGLGFQATVDRIQNVKRFVAERSAELRIARVADDVRAAKRSGHIGVVLGIQNAAAIENDLAYVEALADLGIRFMQLTYHTANLLGDGCLEGRNGGLTRFGRAAVRELNAAAITIDLSHVGERSTLEAIELSAVPVAITHANCAELHPSPRNKSNAVIRAVADADGVIGLTPYPAFVTGDANAATLERYVDHIDYAVEIAGQDHVALGTDFTSGQTLATLVQQSFAKWGGSYPEGGFEELAKIMSASSDDDITETGQPYAVGISDHSELPNVTAMLLRRGYDKHTIRAILGENLLRVFAAAGGARATVDA